VFPACGLGPCRERPRQHRRVIFPRHDLREPRPDPEFHIDLHPSVQRLQVRTNATSIWSALTAGELPPPPERLGKPQELLVWQQGTTSRFRMLGREEALALDEVGRGKEIEIDQSSESFLRGWLEAEIVSNLHRSSNTDEK